MTLTATLPSGQTVETGNWIFSPADGGDVGRVAGMSGSELTIAWMSGVQTRVDADTLDAASAHATRAEAERAACRTAAKAT